MTSAARMTGSEPPKHAQRWQIGARAARRSLRCLGNRNRLSRPTI